MLLRIDGRQMTVGDVVSNVMGCSRISDIFSNLEELCGSSSRDDIANATECWIEVPSIERVKIITSPDDCFAGIERLFECRHIIVHEHPSNRPYDIDELDQMFVNTEQFASALSWFATAKIHGDVPRAQMTMNRQAYDAATKEQEVLYKHIDPPPYVSELMDEYDHHCVWYWFEHLMADARSGLSLGRYVSGSIAPSIYWSEISRLEKWRIGDLARFSDFFPADYFRGGSSS